MPYPFLTNGRIFEEITYMNEDQYISRINQLEKEIGYLHSLLDEAGITYRKEAKNIEDLSPYVYLFQLSRSAYGYEEYLITKTENRDALLEFAFWRTDICRKIYRNADAISRELLQLV